MEEGIVAVKERLEADADQRHLAGAAARLGVSHLSQKETNLQGGDKADNDRVGHDLAVQLHQVDLRHKEPHHELTVRRHQFTHAVEVSTHSKPTGQGARPLAPAEAKGRQAEQSRPPGRMSRLCAVGRGRLVIVFLVQWERGGGRRVKAGGGGPPHDGVVLLEIQVPQSERAESANLPELRDLGHRLALVHKEVECPVNAAHAPPVPTLPPRVVTTRPLHQVEPLRLRAPMHHQGPARLEVQPAEEDLLRAAVCVHEPQPHV
mmetsp:Transcript_41490/g.103566  ORF Transcript_41490/g.103566 Transcript_41490/m.103566 type:complete len:262 (-) Transcript_41490:462-1247(-)